MASLCSMSSSCKVPRVTVWFWAAKVWTTLLGESLSDYLVHKFNPYLAVGIGFVVFSAAIVTQFATPRYRTGMYWTAVAMVAVFGTMVADVLHVALHVPYLVSAPLFLAAAVVILAAWYATEGTLSIHSISTPRREFFYWATVCATFALGTAAGDLTAVTFHLGYLSSAVLYSGLIVLPLAAWRLGLSSVASFWFAYILTRPIGASFADYLGFGHDVGGLGAGHAKVALVSVVLFAALITYLGVSGRDRAATPVEESRHQEASYA